MDKKKTGRTCEGKGDTDRAGNHVKFEKQKNQKARKKSFSTETKDTVKDSNIALHWSENIGQKLPRGGGY